MSEEDVKAYVVLDDRAVTSVGVIPGGTSVAAPVFTTGESLPLVVAVLDTTKAMSAEIRPQNRPAHMHPAPTPERTFRRLTPPSATYALRV